MKFRIVLYVVFLFVINSWGQNGFKFESTKNRIVIPFKFINNLVILPMEVNGTTLNFLLDTGVQETILFSLEDKEQVTFENIEKIKFRGLGSNEPFDGFKSSSNKIAVQKYVDYNHDIYIVLDQNINISSQVGVPVNGIIGYHFFKNNAIAIDYRKKKIIIYKNISTISKKIDKKYTKIAMTIEECKPYIESKIQFENNQSISAKMLVDMGNSDALWLFKERDSKISIPKNNFDDYLGMGFSGVVYGKRARISTFEIEKFKFNKPIVSFPDSLAINPIGMVKDRVGSIGAEIIKRFSVIFDYPNNQIYLKKNSHFQTLFNYNMSGLEIQHEGLQWVQELYEEKPNNSGVIMDMSGDRVLKNLRYKFELKPTYKILTVRKDSPADKAGLKKGDIILKINHRKAYDFTLQEINDLLKSEENRTIQIEVDRNGNPMNFKFQLKNII